MNGFILHLYGPMQSWADTGFGQLREAGDFPSRSAVIGLIAAAMGVPRGAERLIELHELLRIHVATVRPGQILRDFHTVETREGSPRTLTSRDYHHDAHFVALIEGDAGALSEAFDGLSHPVFGMFLGRRSCPPALPLIPAKVSGDPFRELVDTTLATASSFPNNDGTWRRRRSADEVLVWMDGHYDSDTVPRVLSHASSLTYGSRRTRLKGRRRAYAASSFTRVVLPIVNESTYHDTFYHALS